jgi:CDP-glycerol glycerophosphotransferase (TagB/SpsB family)
LDAAGEIDEVQWVVKLHPSEAASDWESVILRKNLKGIRIAQGHIQLWLMACSALVAWYSTTMLEAALLNKPVFAVFIPHCPNAEMYVRDGIAARVEDSEALLDKLRPIVHAEGEIAIKTGISNLADHVYKPDGNAAGRVADLVQSLIDKNAKI